MTPAAAARHDAQRAGARSAIRSGSSSSAPTPTPSPWPMSPKRTQRVLGFIPTGWYPTAVRTSRRRPPGRPQRTRAAQLSESRRVRIRRSKAAPLCPTPAFAPTSTSARIQTGIALGDRSARRRGSCAEYSKTVLANSPYRDRLLEQVPRASGQRRSLPGQAARRPSSTSSTSSRRTAPTIRCSAISAKATAIRRSTLFGEKVTPESPQAGARVRAVRQLLRQRRRQRRRPQLVHRRHRARLRAEDVAQQLRRPAQALRLRRRRARGAAARRIPLDQRRQAGITHAQLRLVVQPTCARAAPTGDSRSQSVRDPILRQRHQPASTAASTSTITDVERAKIFLERPGGLRAERRNAAPHLPAARQRPHLRHGRRARSPRLSAVGRQRLRRSGMIVEAVSRSRFWATHGDLRPRRRRAERAGPRGFAPLPRLRHFALYARAA